MPVNASLTCPHSGCEHVEPVEVDLTIRSASEMMTDTGRVIVVDSRLSPQSEQSVYARFKAHYDAAHTDA